MKKDKISDVQERFLHEYAFGLDTVAAYRQVTGNKKVSASSIRSTVGKWMKKDAIRTRLDALRKESETAKTLRRQEKREYLSDMTKRLVSEFNETLDSVKNLENVSPVEKAQIKSFSLDTAGKLAGRVSKLISVDNQMSGDIAAKEVRNDITSNGKTVGGTTINLQEKIQQLIKKGSGK